MWTRAHTLPDDDRWHSWAVFKYWTRVVCVVHVFRQISSSSALFNVFSAWYLEGGSKQKSWQGRRVVVIFTELLTNIALSPLTQKVQLFGMSKRFTKLSRTVPFHCDDHLH